MSNALIRPAPIYVGNDKIADATEGTYDLDGAMEQVISDGGVGYSRGRVTCKLDVSTMVPVKGMRVRLAELLIGQKDCTVQLFIDGKYQKFDGVLNTGGYTFDHAKGMCKGKWGFIGAEPDITG